VFVVFTEHFVNPGFRDAAKDRMASNGEIMSRQPGFEFRYLLEPVDRSDVLSSITGWGSESAYDAWVEVRKRLPGRVEARQFYSSIEHRGFTEWGSGR